MQRAPFESGRLGAIASRIRDELDGRRAVTTVERLTEWNRTPGSSGYRAAAAFTAEALRQAGIEDAAIVGFPMDGRASYRGWRTEPAWDVSRAEIRVSSPIDLKLADWKAAPIAVHQGSWATADGEIEARLVDVGEGVSAADYAGKPVGGAVVLSSGPPQRVYEEAVVRRGAIGILSQHMPWECPEVGRTPAELPDLVSLGRIRVGLGDQARGFTFSISRRRAKDLQALLDEGPVAVACRIDGGPFAGQLDVVTGRISGDEHPEAEFVIAAHLCHPSPGANDNASGVALGVEIAGALTAARRQAGGPPLRHSVRFLFGPEIIGPLAFLASGTVEVENLIGGINLDMVGASQSITKSPLLFENTPWSLPTYLADVGSALLSLGRASSRDGQWAYRAVPFEGGSDNIVFNDNAVGVPMVGFGYRADPCYHSNLDVWTNMDADVLANVGLAGGALAWTAASMDGRLAREVLRVVRDARLRRASPVPRSVERGTVESVRRRLPRDPAIEAVVDLHLADLPVGPTQEDEPSVEDRKLPRRGRPRRAVPSLVWPSINGTSDFLAALPPDHELRRRLSGFDDVASTRCVYELLNLSDGTRTWGEVLRLVERQFDGVAREDVAGLAGSLLATGALETAEEEKR